MSNKRTQRIQQAATYFDEGLRAICEKWRTNEITSDEFTDWLNEHSAHAQELCRKQIIQAFDMGFKLGVFWHVEITETKQSIARDHGVEYYRNIYENIYEGGES